MQSIINGVLFFGLYLGFLFNGEACGNQLGSEPFIEPIIGRFLHSEGPLWNHHLQKLSFVDIEAQKICRLDPVTKGVACIFIENGPVGFAIPVNGESDKFVAGSGTDFVLVTFNNRRNITKTVLRTLTVVDKDRNGTRWNDGKADTSGRFWGGTIGPEVNDVVVPNQASFYRIRSDFKPRKELSPVTNSNGLAWNIEDDTLYYIDTPTLQIAAFDFEPLDGSISNKRIVFDLQKNNVTGIPDGMTIDINGNLWVALYDGGAVINVDPRTGKVIGTVKLPVTKVTSCIFGGPMLDVLFVTTSSRGLSKKELKDQPYAGYIFRIEELGVRGFSTNAFKA